MLITGDSMLHEIDEKRLSGAKPNSVKVRIFRGPTADDMKDFLKPHLTLIWVGLLGVRFDEGGGGGGQFSRKTKTCR